MACGIGACMGCAVAVKDKKGALVTSGYVLMARYLICADIIWE